MESRFAASVASALPMEGTSVDLCQLNAYNPLKYNVKRGLTMSTNAPESEALTLADAELFEAAKGRSLQPEKDL